MFPVTNSHFREEYCVGLTFSREGQAKTELVIRVARSPKDKSNGSVQFVEK